MQTRAELVPKHCQNLAKQSPAGPAGRLVLSPAECRINHSRCRPLQPHRKSSRLTESHSLGAISVLRTLLLPIHANISLTRYTHIVSSHVCLSNRPEPPGWVPLFYALSLLLPLNVCRKEKYYLPWECENERHAYEKCVLSLWSFCSAFLTSILNLRCQYDE